MSTSNNTSNIVDFVLFLYPIVLRLSHSEKRERAQVYYKRHNYDLVLIHHDVFLFSPPSVSPVFAAIVQFVGVPYDHALYAP